MLILLQDPPVPIVKPIAVKKPRQITTVDKGKGKAIDTSKLLTNQRSTRGKATLANKTIPGTFHKTPAGKAIKSIKKSHASINATTREMNIYIPTVRARRNGTLLYKRTGTRR